MRACPRVHLKMIAIDGALLYLGSANFTGAGLGAKGDGRRNFEMGILTDDEWLLDEAQARFDRIWRGAECAGCRLRGECPPARRLDGRLGGPRLSAAGVPFFASKSPKVKRASALSCWRYCLVRVALLVLAQGLDRELHLAAARIHLDDLRVDLLADLERLAKLGAARRARPRRGHVAARVATRSRRGCARPGRRSRW